MRKTKFVTLKVAKEELSQFPDLTTHVHIAKKPKPRVKAKVAKDGKDIQVKSESVGTTSKQSLLATSGSFNTSSAVKLTLKLTDNESGMSMSPPHSNEGSGSPERPTFSATPSFSKMPQSIPLSSAPSSAGNGGISTATPLGAISNSYAVSKPSPNARLGVSGLSLNPNIVRELDTSKQPVGKWVRYDAPAKEVPEFQSRVAKTLPITATKCIKKTNTGTTFKPVRSHLVVPEPEMLETVHGMISIKDVRGYKEHSEKEKEINLINEAPKRGRRVVRSFTGYLMFCPGWHKNPGEIDNSEANEQEKKEDEKKKDEEQTKELGKKKSDLVPESKTETDTNKLPTDPLPVVFPKAE